MIGTARRRRDGEAKVRGATRFVGDNAAAEGGDAAAGGGDGAAGRGDAGGGNAAGGRAEGASPNVAVEQRMRRGDVEAGFARADAPGAAAHLSHVKVDRETGRVRLLAHVVAQDVGKALNPALVEGQLHGGTAQGIGWALLEALSHSEDGQLQGGTFAEYALPSTDQVPPIETLLVEIPAPASPSGAKGVGEPPVCGVPAGIAAATGIRLGALPMTSERVWALLQDAPVV